VRQPFKLRPFGTGILLANWSYGRMLGKSEVIPEAVGQPFSTR